MRLVGTAENFADSGCEFLSTEQPLRLYDLPLTVDPFGLDRVKPRALLRKQAAHYAHSPAALFDSSVMLLDPALYLFGSVPGGIVPDQKQSLLAHRDELLAAPLKELRGDGTHRATVHEPQPRPFPDPPLGFSSGAHQHPVSRQSLRIGIVFGWHFLEEAHRSSRFGPRVHTRSLEATPPRLILEAQGPLRARKGEPDQPISSPFFLSYSGSGELIHRFARCQRTPNLPKVARMVSPLTFSSVRPSSKLTSAAPSSVQRVLCLPNSLGERCKSSLRASAPPSSKAARVRLGLEEPGVRALRPCSLKAWMALRTVWEAQPKERAICGGRSPRALAKTIWQRRRTKASLERRPLSSCYF